MLKSAISTSKDKTTLPRQIATKRPCSISQTTHYRLAQSLEKLDHPAEARTHYEAYLKILPHGPFSKDAQKALEKLKAAEEKNQSAVKPAQ